MKIFRVYSTISKPRKSLRDSLGKSDLGSLFTLTEKVKLSIDVKMKIANDKAIANGPIKAASGPIKATQNVKAATQTKTIRTESTGKFQKQEPKERFQEPKEIEIVELDDDIDSFSKSKFLKKGSDRDKLKRLREKEKKQQSTDIKSKKEKSKLKNIYLQEGITIANLSSLMDIPVKKVIRKIESAGFNQQSPDYVLNSEIASLIVMEFNMNPIVSQEDTTDLEPRPEPEDWSVFPARPPVITIMGHVDHGKTTLLDSLRKTSVAAGEAGGITQHIGAFSVIVPSGKQITFLDTPGHAAFSQMRQRGAKCTDIVVLVVAADDGVMPQTIEAIKHAQEAQVPIVVALNKCDKHGVNPTKVLEGLLQHNVIVEEMGGDVPCVRISGKTGLGLEELEETILTMSEVLDFRGDATGMVEGTIVESKMSKELGNVATILIKRGTLTPGSIIVAGNAWCKVKRMINDNGKIITSAGPSCPVEVLGWKELPEAGDYVIESKNEAMAKLVSKNRKRKQEFIQTIKDIDVLNEKKVVKDEEAVVEDKIKEYRVIVKSDVHGSLEAIENVLNSLPNHEVAVKIIGSGVGTVTESDIDFANTGKASIYAFNVPLASKITIAAKQANVNLSSHSVIYTVVEKVKEGMSELLDPEIIHAVEGEATVLQLFSITMKKKQEMIAGCRILSGKVMRNQMTRVVRNGEIVHQGSIKTFKHHKKDILEAAKGLECGINIEGFDDVQPGDVIQSINVISKKRTIE